MQLILLLTVLVPLLFISVSAIRTRPVIFQQLDEEGEELTESSTRYPTIAPVFRRNFQRAPTSKTIQETPKTPKSKPTRRRKVKKPPKSSTFKTAATNEPNEDLGSPEGSKGNTTTEKNLAVEIGSEDGKYALIDKFFESRPGTAPGIISYHPSDDFAQDNDRTLGNVQANEIWLSEGHLLVLKGGHLDGTTKETWKPIDAYNRDTKKPPLRIPVDSSNPPPFPVFLNQSGPPVFLGDPPPFGPPPPGFGNDSFDPSLYPPPGLVPLFPNGSVPDYFGPPPPHFGNNSFPLGPPGGLYGGNPNGVYGGPYDKYPPPPGGGKFNFTGGPPPPFFPFHGPPGSQNGSFPHFLPPPPRLNGTNGPNFFLPPLVLNADNETDDPSIFLPPPYDFDYEEDNTTLVPPGPFAPGLVVPPPKNFYSVYNKTSTPKPQRPNGRKPMFPVSSDERPTPYTSTILNNLAKKRKQSEKTNKSIYNTPDGKYSESFDQLPNLQSTAHKIPPERGFKPRPTRPLFPTTTTQKPNNYVYVKGQLQKVEEDDGAFGSQDIGQFPPTPRPPFDSRGYPTRIIDEPQPVLLHYPTRRPTDTTTQQPKVFYYTTSLPPNIQTYSTRPQFSPGSEYSPRPQNYSPQPENYSPRPDNYSPRPQNYSPRPQSYSPRPQNYSPRPDNYSPRPETYSPRPENYSPIKEVEEERHPQQYETFNSPPNSQGKTINNGRGTPPTTVIFLEKGQEGKLNEAQGILYDPQQYQIAGIGPTYFTPYANTNNAVSTEGPKDTENYPIRNTHFHYNAPSRVRPQNVESGSKGNVGFRPAHPPPQRTRLLFPNQQQQQVSEELYGGIKSPPGYYSPISQYIQPLRPVNGNVANVANVAHALNDGFPGFLNSHLQNPNFNLHFLSSGIGKSPDVFLRNPHILFPNNSGRRVVEQPSVSYVGQQQVPLHRDILLNYREPVPQYNTESETVTVRSSGAKAGPRVPARLKSSSPSVVDGSFYSFQRGGPGGFSYKIRL